MLRNRQEFQRSHLTELASTDFESWAKESFDIATKIAYRNGGLSGSPRGGNKDCTTVAAPPVLPVGYVVNASRIADRRMILGGYRLADLLTTAKCIQPRQIEERNRNSNDTRTSNPRSASTARNHNRISSLCHYFATAK